MNITNQSSLEKKVSTVITTTEEYTLSKDIKYIRIIVNDKIVSNTLHYVGENINGYSITPIYKADISILKKWNPFWGENKDGSLNKNNSWFDTIELPEPEKINISEDIIYKQSATHSFFDINLEPIPVVLIGNYIEARLNNANYKLPELKAYFDNHKNIVYCSEIMMVPHYNRGGDSGTHYIEALVYPEVDWLKKQTKNIFTCTWNKNHPDFLNIRQFMVDKKKGKTDKH